MSKIFNKLLALSDEVSGPDKTRTAPRGCVLWYRSRSGLPVVMIGTGHKQNLTITRDIHGVVRVTSPHYFLFTTGVIKTPGAQDDISDICTTEAQLKDIVTTVSANTFATAKALVEKANLLLTCV